MTVPGFLDGYLPYLLRKADQTLSARFYAVLAEAGVARSEWRVITVLAEHGGLRVADLATAALSPQPTVTHALRRLEERGLVTRTTSPDDRRERLVTLTPAGAALTAELVAEATRLEAEALAGAGDLSDLMAQLRDLTARLEARAGATEALAG
ncbi:MAG: MarR family transcriptional regulator [Acidimicrobiaceae bacterium]|nr:MarR family transcriptional regulator [Acidimicrobiaceae bacterium]|tara:strand:- start:2489 stop:2947 length:459 start_codon:yes stop_codon:yes gene_type:complete